MKHFSPSTAIAIIRLSVIGFFLIAMGKALSCEVTDDTGRKVTLTHPAKRIISLAPDLTEILFAAGAGKHIVGVVKGSDYPPAAKSLPVVASYNSIEAENILRLHPDLIVAWTETRYLSQLKTLGIPLYFSQQRQLSDVANTLQKLGCLAGTEKTADAAALAYRQRYQQLQKKYSHQIPITVFYQIWSTPLMTITQQSWINEAITLCGGRNLFADLKGVAPELSLEAVVAANPDVIIGTFSHHDSMQQWQAWPTITAVKTHHLFLIHPDLIDRAGPRLLDGVEEVCHALSLARSKPLNDRTP